MHGQPDNKISISTTVSQTSVYNCLLKILYYQSFKLTGCAWELSAAARVAMTGQSKLIRPDFYCSINELNKFHLTRLDFLYLQKDTYIPIQFLDINYSIFQ